MNVIGRVNRSSDIVWSVGRSRAACMEHCQAIRGVIPEVLVKLSKCVVELCMETASVSTLV